TLMTEPPAAAALLPPATETTGEFTLLLVDIALSVLATALGTRKRQRGGRRAAPVPLHHHEPVQAHGVRRYGSFWSRVNTFCGTVLACATIAVLACCRIC